MGPRAPRRISSQLILGGETTRCYRPVKTDLRARATIPIRPVTAPCHEWARLAFFSGADSHSRLQPARQGARSRFFRRYWIGASDLRQGNPVGPSRSSMRRRREGQVCRGRGFHWHEVRRHVQVQAVGWSFQGASSCQPQCTTDAREGGMKKILYVVGAVLLLVLRSSHAPEHGAVPVDGHVETPVGGGVGSGVVRGAHLDPRRTWTAHLFGGSTKDVSVTGEAVSVDLGPRPCSIRTFELQG